MLASFALILFASGAAAARADVCPVRVLSLSLEGRGTSGHLFRYRAVLEAESGTAPQDIDVQIQTSGGRAPLSARASHVQFLQDEDAFDDVVVFDRPSQDISGISVADTVSSDGALPCTSPTVHVGDQGSGLVGWDIPTVITTFSDEGTIAPDASTIAILSGKSRNAAFTRKPTPYYPPLAQDADVSGKVVVSVRLSPVGQLETAHIDISSGSKLLDNAAMDAARKSTYSGKTLDGIPIVSTYQIVYEFRLDGEPWPPEMSDLLKMYCPAILGHPMVNTSLNSGTAYWYELDLNTVETPLDSVTLEMADAASHTTDLLWNIPLRGYGDTMGTGRDPSIDYSSLSGALFSPGAALTWGQVQATSVHAKKSETCKPYPVDVSNKVDSDSLVAATQTIRPWLTVPIVETVLPARFATVSWPKYDFDAYRPQQPIVLSVSVHVSPLGEPLVALVHSVSIAPALAAAALNAAMESTYVVPHSTDGAAITQTFDVTYLYVPGSAPAGKPVGLVSLDRPHGIRRHTPHN
jgi:TonB family protein